ncbi:MAG: bifunctional UDP-sugar hydrolase/5'-nucleotidase [Bacillota bacterium]|nr:bifunctional UDP-sugar hydrolase/5'-nucleotidase [Bacillota bacterium]
MEKIHIYHTNDIHSHLEYWSRIREFLQKQKEEYIDQENEVFLFDIGDFVDRWHPLSEGTKGKGNISLLNQCGYTAVTIGNNEGINFSFEDLDHLYDDAEFDVLTANLYKQEMKHPHWINPYKIYNTHLGTRVGVIGVTAFFSELYHLLGWEITEPLLELRKWVGIVKEQADVIVLLSHLGIHADEKIATEFPEIDVILGGHSHHTLPNGEQINQSILAAAGKYGEYIGKVTLEINDQKTVESKGAVLYEVALLSETLTEKSEAIALYKRGKGMLSQKIVTLPNALVHNPNVETELSILLCRALKEWCKADCAILNAGILLGSLSEEVTNFDLLTICPHPINPCKIELTGSQVEEVYLQSLDEKWQDMKVKGFGFRGSVMGKFIHEGIRVDKEKEVILINNAKINPTETYSVAIPDMLTFGKFFPTIHSCKLKKYYLPEFLRDLLKWKLEKTFT